MAINRFIKTADVYASRWISQLFWRSWQRLALYYDRSGSSNAATNYRIPCVPKADNKRNCNDRTQGIIKKDIGDQMRVIDSHVHFPENKIIDDGTAILENSNKGIG